VSREGAVASDKLPFSGVVVVCNEIRRLQACLESLSFCSQLVVVDLQSSDGSAELAASCGAEVYRHERVPVVEQIRSTAFAYARHDWIVHIDPDEVFPKQRADEIRALIAEESDAAIIRLPWHFYFRGKPLHGTVWGGDNSRQAVYHRGRVRLSADVHRATTPLPGFRELFMDDARLWAIRHFWVDTYAQMLEKHLRYLRHEGASRHASGERFSWLKAVIEPSMAFKRSFLDCRGWADGMAGVFLSFFYAWYVFMSYLSLRRYQKEFNHNG